MPKRGVFDEETRMMDQHEKRDPEFHEDYKKWREEWKQRGPVEFAYKILKFDPNTGKALNLSEGQREFLIDVGTKGIRLAIIAAGRGSGKTFVLAVYIMWRIFTHEDYHIACMGGSQEQSDKIASYISGWIRNNSILKQYCLKLILREVKTHKNGSATFHACSATSVRGPHCYSEDTEILTENGWKLFKVLSKGEKVATLSSAGFLEWQEPYEIVNEPYEGKMAVIKQQDIDLIVTPNHRLWGRKQHKSDYEFILPNQLTQTTRMTAIAKWKGVPTLITEGENLEFLGYYLSEGNPDIRKIKIRQSKTVNPEKYNKIELCLQRLKLSYHAYDDKFIIYSKDLTEKMSQYGKYAWEKYIPKEIKEMPPTLLQRLFKALILGDGETLNNVPLRYTTTSQRLRDDVIEIALKLGISSSYQERPSIPSFSGKYISKKYWVITFHKRKERIVKNLPRYINYSGRVYCVAVPNHIIIVRRNGRMIWSGNTHDVIIDEQAAGEEKGGGRFIRAAIWEVSTSPDIHIIQCSTAHYIHGDFLQTWNNYQKLGYKRYNWAIAKHINGETDPYKIYQDGNPKHWKSNIPWMPDLNVEILRTKESNDSWLVEALGGISITSGLVFNPLDLGACLCDRGPCDICEAYKDRVCAIIQYIAFTEGIPKEAIPLKTSDCLKRYVHERILGIDWGRGSPCAYVVLGRFKDWVFVLEAIELIGQTDQEKVQIALDLCKKWDVEIVRPDPREWVLNNQIADAGYAVHELFSFSGGSEKYQYIATLKKYVERHKLVLPARVQQNEDLIRSLRNLTFDEAGKIRKQDDHSADACMYAISYYDEVETSSPVYELKKDEQGLHSLW